MRKNFLLPAVIVISFAVIPARSQSAQGPVLKYPDFSISLPKDWVIVRPSGDVICSMEGAERTDGAKPELTIRAISDEGQTDNQLKEATLNTYSKFNVIAHGEQSATVANLSTYEVELKFRLKNQPKPELERVTFHAVWFFMRIPSQKKIYTLIWLDRDEDFKEGARVVWGAIQSFKPTH